MSTLSVVALGCLAVLVFDAFAALVSRTTRVPYTWFAPGSFVIYLATGYFAGGAADSVLVGAAAGAMAATVDATLGSVIGRGLQADFDDSIPKRVEVGAAGFVMKSYPGVGAVIGTRSA